MSGARETETGKYSLSVCMSGARMLLLLSSLVCVCLSCAAVCSPVSVLCSELAELWQCGASLRSELLSDLFLTSVFGRCVEPQGPLSEPVM